MGKNINVGCGVVFVNYDGTNKLHTNVGDHAFIGSNSNIVAPVNIAADSFVAAGSTITDSTEQFDMAIARARQVNKPGYAKNSPGKSLFLGGITIIKSDELRSLRYRRT